MSEAKASRDTKRVGLVGHCTPDSAHLKMIVRGAVPDAEVIRVTTDAATEQLIQEGVDLLLVNRAMEDTFSMAIGTDYMRQLRERYPSVRMMLISNYPDAQEAAVKEGALRGFGKNALTSPATKQLLQDALK
jgi:DNA-binding NarL/FixJ family response regulator